MHRFFSAQSAHLSLYLRKQIPIEAGISTINKLKKISKYGTVAARPVNPCVHINNNKGNVANANKLETTVIATDRAKSPLLQYVMAFETAPPGQHPISTMTNASKSSIANIAVTHLAAAGTTIYCDAKPTTNAAFRLRSTAFRSLIRTPEPMPNMTEHRKT